jgi:hypothetical protein
MLAVLLVAFMMSVQAALLAMLAATFVALMIQWRWKEKAGAAKSLRPLILIGGVVLTGLVTLLVRMHLFIDAELAPTREIAAKTKEIEKIFEQHGDQRFTAAKLVVDGGLTDHVRKRLSETLLEKFRNADWHNIPVSDSDLRSLESLLDEYSPSPAGKRACTLYHAHLYIRQTDLAGVHQVLSEYPAVAYCAGKVEYLRLLHRRCAATEESRAHCAALLPRQQLVAMRDASGSDMGLDYALDTLLESVYGDAD